MDEDPPSRADRIMKNASPAIRRKIEKWVHSYFVKSFPLAIPGSAKMPKEAWSKANTVLREFNRKKYDSARDLIIKLLDDTEHVSLKKVKELTFECGYGGRYSDHPVIKEIKEYIKDPSLQEDFISDDEDREHYDKWKVTSLGEWGGSIMTKFNGWKGLFYLISNPQRDYEPFEVYQKILAGELTESSRKDSVEKANHIVQAFKIKRELQGYEARLKNKGLNNEDVAKYRGLQEEFENLTNRISPIHPEVFNISGKQLYSEVRIPNEKETIEDRLKKCLSADPSKQLLSELSALMFLRGLDKVITQNPGYFKKSFKAVKRSLKDYLQGLDFSGEVREKGIEITATIDSGMKHLRPSYISGTNCCVFFPGKKNIASIGYSLDPNITALSVEDDLAFNSDSLFFAGLFAKAIMVRVKSNDKKECLLVDGVLMSKSREDLIRTHINARPGLKNEGRVDWKEIVFYSILEYAKSKKISRILINASHSEDNKTQQCVHEFPEYIARMVGYKPGEDYSVDEIRGIRTFKLNEQKLPCRIEDFRYTHWIEKEPLKKEVLQELRKGFDTYYGTQYIDAGYLWKKHLTGNPRLLDSELIEERKRIKEEYGMDFLKLTSESPDNDYSWNFCIGPIRAIEVNLEDKRISSEHSRLKSKYYGTLENHASK